MAWPNFMDFYSQLPADRLGELAESLQDPEFISWSALFEGLPSDTQKVLAEKLPPLIMQTAMTCSVHLLRSYHDWLGQIAHDINS